MSKSKSISLKDFESKLIKDLKDPFKQNKAFEILIDKYKEKVYFQIRRIVLNHDDTDDILQNVFIKVFRGIKGFKGESKLSTWIYRVAYNESINFLFNFSFLSTLYEATMFPTQSISKFLDAVTDSWSKFSNFIE